MKHHSSFRSGSLFQRDFGSVFKRCIQAITRYGGHVAKYLGDGVMAFFGYPEAHDNDAERAIRAGLALVNTIATLNANGGHLKLAAALASVQARWSLALVSAAIRMS
jgi:class 3 adenylate cyclase